MRCKALKPTSDSRLQDFRSVRGKLAYILQRAHSFVASKYCKWRKGSRPRKGSRSVAWLDGMVETLVSARKPLEPTSYPRLQDFLDALQSFEAYLRFQATGFSGYVASFEAYTPLQWNL